MWDVRRISVTGCNCVTVLGNHFRNGTTVLSVAWIALLTLASQCGSTQPELPPECLTLSSYL